MLIPSGGVDDDDGSCITEGRSFSGIISAD
jgi:hypothetical protein